MILVYLTDNEATKVELSNIILKDKACVTGMVEILRKNGYLQRRNNKKTLPLQNFTHKKGHNTIAKLKQIITSNKATAILNMELKDLIKLQETVNQIIENRTK